MKRKTVKGAFYHTYKITSDGGVLFYRTIDHLVYYSMQSVMSRRHHLRVLLTTHMFTHIHELDAPEDIVQLSDYHRDLSAMFARVYNTETRRRGPLFDGRFGCAPKWGEKAQRSCAVYVMNNPVEKKLVRRAEEDRWTFLAYYEKEYPFSSRPTIRRSRKILVDAIHQVEHEYRAGRYLGYGLLFHFFSLMTTPEREQLTDYIIQRYFFQDRKACYDLFGGYDRMLGAAEVSRGSEYDIKEEYGWASDIPFREMCSIAGKYGILDQGMPMFHLPDARLDKLALLFQNTTSASDKQISRFIHRL